MLYGSAGARDTAERGIYQGFQVLNATNAPITATVLGQPTTFEPGAAFVTGSNIPRNDNNEAAQVGLRLKGAGLGITHQLNMGYSHSRYVNRNAFEFRPSDPTRFVLPSNNLYNPVQVARTAYKGFLTGPLADPNHPTPTP